MNHPAFYDGSTATVATPMPDGRVVRVPIGDFLQSQRGVAHELRRAAIDAAIDKLLQRLRAYRRGALRLTTARVQTLRAGWTLCLLCALAAPAFAGPPGSGSSGSSSGPVLIDQAKAEAGGVTAGDAAGFPVTISQPGSYRLMSNLIVADANVSAIQITADGVTLDLNGYTLQGPVVCTNGSPASISCTPGTASGSGVYAYAKNDVAVRNGNIRGFGVGVTAGQFGRYEQLNIAHIRGSGISSSEGNQLTGNVVRIVGGDGIAGYGDFRDNHVYMVRLHGINSGNGSLIIGNRVNQVGYYGIKAVEFSAAALAQNVVQGAGHGALFGGTKIGGNFCDGLLC